MDWQNFSQQLIEFVKNHPIVSIIFVCSLLWFLKLQIQIMIDRIKLTDTTHVVNWINHEDAIVIDVRSKDEYKQGHVINAIDLNLENLKNGQFQRIDSMKDKKIIVVGKGYEDVDAYNCAKVLKKNGFLHTFLLDGGMVEWTSKNLPLSYK